MPRGVAQGGTAAAGLLPSDGATGPDSTLCRPGLRSPAPGGTGHRLAAVPRAGLGAFAPSLLGGRTPPSVEPVLAPAFPRSLLGSPNPPACVCVSTVRTHAVREGRALSGSGWRGERPRNTADPGSELNSHNPEPRVAGCHGPRARHAVLLLSLCHRVLTPECIGVPRPNSKVRPPNVHLRPPAGGSRGCWSGAQAWGTRGPWDSLPSAASRSGPKHAQGLDRPSLCLGDHKGSRA